MKCPHESQFRLRPHAFFGAIAVSVLVGLSGTAQAFADKAANPLWSAIAVGAGFSIVWVGLSLISALKSLPRVWARRACLLAFYIFPVGAVGSILLSGLAGQSSLEEFTVILPASFGAAAAAYWVYSRTLPSNTSLERTREG